MPSFLSGFRNTCFMLLCMLPLSGCFIEIDISGKGRVKSSSGNIDCEYPQNDVCEDEFLDDETVQISAVAAPGWQFQHWISSNLDQVAPSPCNASTDSICTLEIGPEQEQLSFGYKNNELYLTAVFVESPITFSTPLNDATLTTAQSISLVAEAVDPTPPHNNLSANIVYRSNIDGLLAPNQTLTAGKHKLTASVDIAGTTHEAAVNVLVISDEIEIPPTLESAPNGWSPVAASWDGRIQFGWKPQCGTPVTTPIEPVVCGQEAGKASFRAWSIWVFKPEAVLQNTPGTIISPTNNRSQNFSPRVYFDTDPYIDDNSQLVSSSSHTNGRSHINVFPDPQYVENPYKSDANGAAASNGGFETYRMLAIGRFDCTRDTGDLVDIDGVPQCNNTNTTNKKGYFARLPLQVVVKNPRSNSASIESATYMIEPNESVVKAINLEDTDNVVLQGLEPSMSFDGRLLVWQGHDADSGRSSFIYYSYNATPGAALGWSKMKPLTSMYYEHGPGATTETVVGSDQIKFSELYPIAANPLKTPDGTEFANGEPFPGTYPWLSFDATEISFSAAVNFNGARRAGLSIAGELTNWTVQLIDGPANLTRSNVWPTYKKSATARSDLKDLYDDLFKVGDGKIFEGDSWRRHLVSNVGLSDTMWALDLGMSNSVLPISNQELTYQLGLSNSGDYIEVPLNSVADKHYILRWPMNEILNYDRDTIADEISETDNSAYTQFKLESVMFSSQSSPDIAGHHWNGDLSGLAFFPFEQYSAEDLYDHNSRVVVGTNVFDITEGKSGNSIAFIYGGTLTSLPFNQLSIPDQTALTNKLTELVSSQAFTLEAWIKPNFSADMTFLDVSGLVSLSFTSDGKLSATITGTADTHISTAASKLTDNDWAHVAVRVESGQVSLFVDGQALAQGPLLHPLVVATTTVDLTVKAGALGWSGVRIDEVAFSNVGRTVEEIRKSALLKDSKAIASSFTGVPIPNEYDNLRQNISDSQYQGSGININDVIDLGHSLFLDSILSSNDLISCASCHKPASLYADTVQFSTGVGGSAPRNTPSLVNRLFGSQHMLDGRAGSLEEQVLFPIENPVEMGLPIANAILKLNNSNSHKTAFQSVFSEDPNRDNLAFALASFVRTIVIDPAPTGTIGKALFEGKARCTSCHNGPNFSNESFHNVGILQGDPGRAAVTGRSADDGKFRTPGLWGVSQTAPYFHDGRFTTLTQVVDFYDRGGDSVGGSFHNRDFRLKPLGLTDTERDELVIYLESLGGTLLSQ